MGWTYRTVRDTDLHLPLAPPTPDELDHWADLADRHHPDRDECGTGSGCPDYTYAVTQIGTHDAWHLLADTPEITTNTKEQPSP